MDNKENKAVQSTGDEKEYRWVSERVGDEYKEWKIGDKIFIEATTGTGKTYFVLHVLLKWLRESPIFRENETSNTTTPICNPFSIHPILPKNRILYLVNRRILKRQIEEELKKIEQELNAKAIFNGTSYIDIMTYQEIEKTLQNGNEYPIERIKSYYFIVFDECHYFIQDSTFNTNTEISFRYLMKYVNEAVSIFLSATIKAFRDVFTNMNLKFDGSYDLSSFLQKKYIINNFESKYKNYEVKKKYDYVSFSYINGIDEICDLIEMDNSGDKWLIFINSYRLGKKIERELKELDVDALFLDAEYRKYEEMNKTVVGIAEKNMINHNVLIATSVLDNGVSLKEREIKNIVIISDDEVEFIQMLGRRRIEENERIMLYISVPDPQIYERRLIKLGNIFNKMLYFDSLVNGKPKEKALLNAYNSWEELDLYRKFIYFRYDNWTEIIAQRDMIIKDMTVPRDAVGSLLRTVESLNTPKPYINNFARIKIALELQFYENEIQKYKSGSELDLLKTKLLWIGKTLEEAHLIFAMAIDERKELYIKDIDKALNDIVDKPKLKEEWIRFYREDLIGLMEICKILKAEELIDKNQCNKYVEALRKGDKVRVSEKVFKELMSLIKLDYCLLAGGNPYTYTVKRENVQLESENKLVSG